MRTNPSWRGVQIVAVVSVSMGMAAGLIGGGSGGCGGGGGFRSASGFCVRSGTGIGVAVVGLAAWRRYRWRPTSEIVCTYQKNQH